MEIRRLQRRLEALEMRLSSARVNPWGRNVGVVEAEIARLEGRLRLLVESGSALASDQPPQGGNHVA